MRPDAEIFDALRQEVGLVSALRYAATWQAALRPDATTPLPLMSTGARAERWPDREVSEESVAAARRSRRALVSDLRRDLASISEVLEGRLLAYWPARTLFYGMAMHESGGFFDHDGAPPADCWVAWVAAGSEGGLVSWVHPGWLDRARRALEEDPDTCWTWAPSSTLMELVAGAERG